MANARKFKNYKNLHAWLKKSGINLKPNPVFESLLNLNSSFLEELRGYISWQNGKLEIFDKRLKEIIEDEKKYLSDQKEKLRERAAPKYKRSEYQNLYRLIKNTGKFGKKAGPVAAWIYENLGPNTSQLVLSEQFISLGLCASGGYKDLIKELRLSNILAQPRDWENFSWLAPHPRIEKYLRRENSSIKGVNIVGDFESVLKAKDDRILTLEERVKELENRLKKYEEKTDKKIENIEGVLDQIIDGTITAGYFKSGWTRKDGTDYHKSGAAVRGGYEIISLPKGVDDRFLLYSRRGKIKEHVTLDMYRHWLDQWVCPGSELYGLDADDAIERLNEQTQH